MSAWWWYRLIKNDFSGRGMRVPTRSELKALGEIEKQLIDRFGDEEESRAVLTDAAFQFMLSREDEVVSHESERTSKAGNKYTASWEDDAALPWAGVRSMWALFISQAPVWIEMAIQERKSYREHMAKMIAPKKSP